MTALTVRRQIPAKAELLFAAWTEPEQLRHWWGPPGVVCHTAEVDLRVGGAYRLGNRLPNGETVWIEGVFEHVEPPTKLVYTWSLHSDAPEERVTVHFRERGKVTEVIVTHERILDAAARKSHEEGWIGCLQGLAQHLAEQCSMG
ncbi:MAG: SRPBCC domain-containing protein [Myxococcota bacterium]